MSKRVSDCDKSIIRRFHTLAVPLPAQLIRPGLVWLAYLRSSLGALPWGHWVAGCLGQWAVGCRMEWGQEGRDRGMRTDGGI